MRKYFAIAALVASVSVINAAAAETADYEPKIKRAMAEIDVGNIGKAADLFDEISAHLKAEKVTNLAKFLPSAPAGWQDITASAEAESANNNANNSKKIFSKEEQVVNLSFVTDSKLMTAISALMTLANTMGEDGKPNKAIKNYGDFIYKYEKVEKDNEYSLSLFVSDKLLIEISGATLTEPEALEFIKLIDLPNLKLESNK